MNSLCCIGSGVSNFRSEINFRHNWIDLHFKFEPFVSLWFPCFQIYIIYTSGRFPDENRTDFSISVFLKHSFRAMCAWAQTKRSCCPISTYVCGPCRPCFGLTLILRGSLLVSGATAALVDTNQISRTECNSE